MLNQLSHPGAPNLPILMNAAIIMKRKGRIRVDMSVIKLCLTLKLRMSHLDERPFVLALSCSTFLGSFSFPLQGRSFHNTQSSNTSLQFYPDTHNLEGTIVNSYVTKTNTKQQKVNQYLDLKTTTKETVEGHAFLILQ